MISRILAGSNPKFQELTRSTYGSVPNRGDVTSVTDPGGNTWSFTYDAANAAGNIQSTTLPGSFVTTNGFDGAGNLASITTTKSGAAFTGVNYTRDAVGLVTGGALLDRRRRVSEHRALHDVQQGASLRR